MSSCADACTDPSKGHRLVEERQVEVFDIDEFKLGVGTVARERCPVAWLSGPLGY